MATGYNTTSKEEAKEAILEYVAIDTDEITMVHLKAMGLENVCGMLDLDLEESETEFEEDFDF